MRALSLDPDAPMLDLPIAIVSHDPISGAEIRVRLRPVETAS
jgi:hypothetical protein